MYKKILVFIMSAVFLLVLSVCIVYAEDMTDKTPSDTMPTKEQNEPWQNGGGKQGGFGGQKPNRENTQSPEGVEIPEGMPPFENGEFTPPQNQDGTGFQRPGRDFGGMQQNNSQADMTDFQADNGQNVNDETKTSNEQQDTAVPSDNQQQGAANEQENVKQNNFVSQRPSGNFGNMAQNGQFNPIGTTVNEQPMTSEQTSTNAFSVQDFLKEYKTPVISVVLLLFTFIFVKLYKRKNY